MADETDASPQDDTAPAIPTSGDDQDQDQDAQTDTDQDGDQPTDDQQAGPADGQNAAVPGAAQSPGAAISELQALVRAVSQYGMKMAQQQQQQPQPQGPQGPQAQSFEEGGAIPTSDEDKDTQKPGIVERGMKAFGDWAKKPLPPIIPGLGKGDPNKRLGYAEGGAIPTTGDDDDDQPTGSTPPQQAPAQQQAEPAPGYQQEGPFTPTEQGMNTREKALDKSGLGGAFGAAQHKQIDTARQDYAQKGASQSELQAPEAPPTTMAGLKPPHQVLQEGPIGQAVGAGYEGLKKYLSGDRAMDPNTVSAIGYAVDPNGALPPVQRKMQMVQYAYMKGLQEAGDPRKAMDVALGVLQHQRKEFDMWRTAAAVKLASHQDMGSAIDAANKAFQAPFGDNVHFAQASNGLVTATVTGDDGAVQGSFPMQPGSFQQLLQKDGKFDSLVQNGIFETLAGLSQTGPAAPGAVGLSGTRADAGGKQFASNSSAPVSHAMPTPKAKPADTLEAQSRRIFPMVGSEPQRQMWISQQQDKEKAMGSKENIAHIQSEGRNEGRQITAEAAGQRATARDAASMDRVNARDQASMDRTQYREGQHNERFDKGWEQRAQAASLKQAGQNRNDPNNARKTALVKSLIQQYSGDPEGFKKALGTYGLDYDRDIAGTSAGQPTQQAPAPSGGNQGGPQTGQTAPPKVGEVRKGYRFLGGNPKDKAAWERAE